ncbi:Uncharacterised protein [Serratia proteamaculans]|nr:Uncharacterised protein [Serratia proteamaculans]
MVVWWLVQNSDEVTLTGCEHQQRISTGEFMRINNEPPSGELARHDDLADALFAAELAQQLLGGLQPGSAVAQIN